MFNKISALRNKSVLIVILIILVSVVPFSHFIFFYLLSDTIEAPSISENKAADNTNKFVPEEGVFYMGIGDSLGNMDIHSDDSSYLLALNVYDRLFEMKTDSDGKPVLVNSLVKKYSVTPDGKSYNFELRENVGFSDGTPLTAYDVEYSFTRMLSNEDSVQQGFVDMIDGASELLENKTDTLRGIKIDDDTHFTINLSAPFPAFIYNLAAPACSILSKKSVEDGGSLFGKTTEYTIGSGPYVVSKWSEDEYVFDRNELFWGGECSARKVVVKRYNPSYMNEAFKRGEIDYLSTEYVNKEIIERNNTEEDFSKDVRTVSFNCVEINVLTMNADKPLLRDVRVRKAIQHAINRQAIIDNVLDGEAVLFDGIFPKGLMGYSEKNQGWLDYDPDESRRLLREVGVTDDFTFELALTLTSGNVWQDKIAEMIADDLSDVGLPVTVVVYDNAGRLYLRRKGKLMLNFYHWMADINDPDNFIYCLFSSPERPDYYSLGYHDTETMERVVKARNIIDDEKRMEEYASLERKLVEEDAIFVPLYSERHIFILGDRVESIKPYWAGWTSIAFADVVMR